MTPEQLMKQFTDEGNAQKINDMYDALYRNVCDVVGGESKIDPYHLANLRGSIIRSKHYALLAIKELYDAEQPSPVRVAVPGF